MNETGTTPETIAEELGALIHDEIERLDPVSDAILWADLPESNRAIYTEVGHCLLNRPDLLRRAYLLADKNGVHRTAVRSK